jgi:cysteine desulfurase
VTRDPSGVQRLDRRISGIKIAGWLNATVPIVAISNGSACTSQSYEPSHVLVAAGLTDDKVAGALRLSWSHLTDDVPWAEVADRLTRLRAIKR